MARKVLKQGVEPCPRLGEDLTNYHPTQGYERFKPEVDRVQDLYHELNETIRETESVLDEIQGLSLKKDEIAGYNDDRGKRLQASQAKEESLVNELKKAGVVGDDFGDHIEQLRLSIISKNISQDKFTDENFRDAIGIMGSSKAVREHISSIISPEDATHLAKLGDVDFKFLSQHVKTNFGQDKARARLMEQKHKWGTDTEGYASTDHNYGLHGEGLYARFQQFGKAEVHQKELQLAEQDANAKSKRKGGRSNRGGMGGVKFSKEQLDYIQSYKKADDLVIKARNEASKEIYNIEAKSPKFGASRYAELNNRQNAFWKSSTDTLNEAQKGYKKAVLEVAEAGEEGKRKLEQLAMQTTQTFSLIGNDLPTNLLNVRDATIDTLTSLKDATKGGLLGVDLDSEIDKLEELQRDQMQNLDSILSTKNNLTDSEGAFKLMGDKDKIVRSAISNIYDMMASQMSDNQHETQRLAGLEGREKANNKVKGLSTGGFVSGPMGRDVIPAMLTDGEFVIRADVAKKCEVFLNI